MYGQLYYHYKLQASLRPNLHDSVTIVSLHDLLENRNPHSPIISTHHSTQRLLSTLTMLQSMYQIYAVDRIA